MASKDPAFIFYPGDYLRDTQCLSEKVQVAYDRIMCEHMRNICITQDQLNFFTKRLNEEEKSELLMVLTKIKGGYQIHWVAESISKRRAYSESRSKNRSKKPKEDMNNICKHMEIEIENVIEDETVVNKGVQGGLSGLEISTTIEFISITAQRLLTPAEVEDYWNAFKIHSTGKFYPNHSEEVQHFRNWLKKQDKPKNHIKNDSSKTLFQKHQEVNQQLKEIWKQES